MNLQFNAEEFRCLLQDLREANPEMSESELLELASLVHNVQGMPEEEAPKNLFDKIKREINYQDGEANYSEKMTEKELPKDLPWLDNLVKSLQAYLLPFSSGAVAMLIMITVFDLPQINSNSIEPMESSMTDQSAEIISDESTLSNESKLSPNVIVESMNSGVDPKVVKKPPIPMQAVASLGSEFANHAKRPRIANLKLTKSRSRVQALGMGREVPQNFSNEPVNSGQVRSKMMASLKSRTDDWIPRKSKSEKVLWTEESVGQISSNQFAYQENFSSYAGLSSPESSAGDQIDNEFARSPLIKPTASREALEIHWKLSIRELSKARNLMKSSLPEINHIRHLNAEDLEDYSEISGEIITDSFFLKLDLSKLKSLIKAAKDLGSFWTPDTAGKKSPKNFQDYLNKHQARDDMVLDIQLLLYINE
tara:strand:- start:1314 stop:2582 length:1269 start_codon:yes stop_codon:yes gene_type:complete